MTRGPRFFTRRPPRATPTIPLCRRSMMAATRHRRRRARTMETASSQKRGTAGKIAYYVALIGGVAIFVALPFVAIQQPWSLVITVPLVLIWGVWVLSSYWRWVRTLGK